MTFDFDKGAPTTFAPVVTQLDVPLLKALAKKYEKPITLYDLETSDFVHMPVFGITEVGAVHIYPDGTVMEHGTLVNPEVPISENAAQVTGISQEMVKDMPNWGHTARDYFDYWSKNHIVLGFNSLDFDNAGVVRENLRYGGNPIQWNDTRDVRSFWRIFSATPFWKKYAEEKEIFKKYDEVEGRVIEIEASKRIGVRGRGKLEAIAEAFGYKLEGAHRAINDVRMTAQVMEWMLDKMGMDFFDHPGGKMSPKKALENIWLQGPATKNNPSGLVNKEERILEIIEQCGFTTTNRLMLMANMSQRDLNDRLTDLLEAGLLDYELLEDKDAQAWFRERVPVVLADAWTGQNRGKLKIIFEKITEYADKGLLPKYNNVSKYPFNYQTSYLQLKIYMIASGIMAGIEKSSQPIAVEKQSALNAEAYSGLTPSF